MADAPKILAQRTDADTAQHDLYTVPALTSTVVASVLVCNYTGSPSTFRITAAPAGAVDAASQRLYWDVPIAANDTFVATIGLSLATTDKIRVSAGNASALAFTATGIEIT